MSGRGEVLGLTGVLGRAGAAVVLAVALSVLASVPAHARVEIIHGKAYGVMLPPSAQLSLSSAGRATPLAVGGPQSQLTYGGGPLMLSSKLYLIFWGPEHSFSPSYTEPIIQYAKDLQADESLTTDEFSVAELYANSAKTHITGNVTFGGAVFDTTPYPALDKAEGCNAAPCVTDSQIQSEILSQINSRKWPADKAGTPEAQYLLFTPNGAASCIGPGECDFSAEGFCAYHSQITGIAPGGRVATYSNLPYQSECDSLQAPSGVGGNADADGTLDSAIHEMVESATDPAGTGYLDAQENEIADKCTFPVVETPPEIYGTPLGGSLAADTAFNQLIGGDSYYTQQMWSNEPTQTPATLSPAGCVARIGPTPSFTAPASVQAGHVASFDAGGSYDISKPIATYEWNYGDGSPPDTVSGATAKHSYATPGTYQVSLTVSDSSGSTDASTQTLPIIVAAIGPPVAITAPADNPTDTPGQAVASGSPSGTSASSSSPSGASAGPGAPPATQPGAKPAVLTRAQKLARAIKACRKLKQSKQARCIALAKKRFPPPKHKKT